VFPRAAPEKLAGILTLDGREPVMARRTQPEPEQQVVLEKLGWRLPPQPPPWIRAMAAGEKGAVGASKMNKT